jgi:mono/diheme cytochrome c family protein
MPTTMITPQAALTETTAAGTPAPSAGGAPTATYTPVVDLSRGERVYINQNCGQCHGEQGVGVPDKGSALAGTTLSYAEFEDSLRTAYKGELGTDHIFGPNRISPGGVEALHTWLQSLPAPN